MIAPLDTNIVVREATPAEIIDWDAVLARFENSTVFQRSAWLRSIEAFSGAWPLLLMIEKSGELVACLPGFIVRKALLRIFGSPLVGWQTESMGPAFDRHRTDTAEIFGAVVPYLEKVHHVHHFELVSSALEHVSMERLGFEAIQIANLRVPLFPGDEERVMKNLHPKTRNQLRKAIKLGLIARVETDDSFVDEFWSQIQEVFTRRGNSVPFSRNRVLQLFRQLHPSGELLAISVRLPDDTTCIATGIFLVGNRELHLWGWTHRTAHRSLCPTELMTWTAMQKGMEAGCLALDMAGGGDAKMKFGAVPDYSRHRWVRSRYPWLRHLRQYAERAYRRQQSLRGRITRRMKSLRSRR